MDVVADIAAREQFPAVVDEVLDQVGVHHPASDQVGRCPVQGDMVRMPVAANWVKGQHDLRV